MTDAFAALEMLGRWLAWRLERRGSTKAMPTKVPYAASGKGNYGSSTDPRTWGSRSEAEARVAGLAKGPDTMTGIGIALGEIDDSWTLAGIDLDACLDENGRLAPWAAAILETVDSYAEISPSGRGIKIFFLVPTVAVRPFLDAIGVEPTAWGCRRSIPGLSGADHGPALEVFAGARFFTVTEEDLWDIEHPEIVRIDETALARLAPLIPGGPSRAGARAGEREAGAIPRPSTGADNSRSAAALRAVLTMAPDTYEEMVKGLREHAEANIRTWVDDKGEVHNKRELRRLWNRFAFRRARERAGAMADLDKRAGLSVTETGDSGPAPTSGNSEPGPAGEKPKASRGNGHDREAEEGSGNPKVSEGGAGGGGGDGGGDGSGGLLGNDSGSSDEDEPTRSLPPANLNIEEDENDDELGERRKSQPRYAALIVYFNERYACVNEAGKFWVFEQRRDRTLRRDVLDHIKRDDFCHLWENRRLAVWSDEARKFVTKTWAQWWLGSVHRRQYDGVVLDPTCRHSNHMWNLWRGYGVISMPGEWDLMRQHIERVICSGVPEWSEYLLNWLAYMLQHPERPGEVAVVLRGDEGTGKGILGRAIVAMLGTHGLQITDAGNLLGRFSEHLRDLVFLFCDEAFFAGDKKHEGRLKALITEPQMTIEGKFKSVVTVRNYLHLLISSNNDWVVPASLRARRWFPLEVPDTHIRDTSYFTAIVRQLKGGGLEGMLYDLLHRDLGSFDVRAVPLTDELRIQKLLSLPSLERWWLAVLSRGFVWKSRHGVPWFADWHDFYSTELLTRSYLQWCDEHHPFDRKTREQLGIFFRDIYRSFRPRGEHPVHEIDSIDRRAIEGVRGSDGSWIKLPSTLDDEAIVWKEQQYGYTVGELDEARARFLECRDIRPAPWTNPE